MVARRSPVAPPSWGTIKRRDPFRRDIIATLALFSIRCESSSERSFRVHEKEGFERGIRLWRCGRRFASSYRGLVVVGRVSIVTQNKKGADVKNAISAKALSLLGDFDGAPGSNLESDDQVSRRSAGLSTAYPSNAASSSGTVARALPYCSSAPWISPVSARLRARFARGCAKSGFSRSA